MSKKKNTKKTWVKDFKEAPTHVYDIILLYFSYF